MKMNQCEDLDNTSLKFPTRWTSLEILVLEESHKRNLVLFVCGPPISPISAGIVLKIPLSAPIVKMTLGNE